MKNYSKKNLQNQAFQYMKVALKQLTLKTLEAFQSHREMKTFSFYIIFLIQVGQYPEP